MMPWVQTPVPYKPSKTALACNPCTGEDQKFKVILLPGCIANLRPAAKADDLSLIPRPHMMEGENHPLQSVCPLTSICAPWYTPIIHVHTIS